MTSKTDNTNNAYHIRIKPSEGRFRLGFAELWKYRDLVLILTKKTFTVTYQQTALGPLWIILHPVFSSLIYMFIFGHIADIDTDGIPGILFYFISTAVWELFSYSLLSNSNTFVTNAYLFSKVYFPRLAVPVSNMLVSILKFFIQLIIISVLLAVFVFKGMVSPMWGYFPILIVLFIQMSLLGMTIGILLSSLTTKYRDLQIVVNMFVTLGMYATPIVYPLSAVEDGVLKTLIKINPASEVVELIRLIMLGKGEFDLHFYILGLVILIIFFLSSVLVFNHVQRTFADRV